MTAKSTDRSARNTTRDATDYTATRGTDGGSSSSTMIATFFGISLGAISRPASNWRGRHLDHS